MVPMARILVVGVVFIAAPCAFAELKPTRQPISANAAAETNFMLSPLCVSLRRPGEPVGRASPARQPDSTTHDDLACLPGARSRESGHRGAAASWYGSGAPRRHAPRMVSAAPGT